MEFIVRAQEADYLDVEFVGERVTLLNLLKERLLVDSKVVTATVVTDHPVLANPRIVVRTDGADPVGVLKRVAGELRQELDAFEDGFLKALA